MSEPTNEQKTELYNALVDQIFTAGKLCDDDCIGLQTPANCEIFSEELDENSDEDSLRCERCIFVFGHRVD